MALDFVHDGLVDRDLERDRLYDRHWHGFHHANRHRLLDFNRNYLLDGRRHLFLDYLNYRLLHLRTQRTLARSEGATKGENG